MGHARCPSHSQSLHPAVFVGSLGSGQLVLLSRLLGWCLALGFISSALPQQQLLSVPSVCGSSSSSSLGWGCLLRTGHSQPAWHQQWAGEGWQALFGY